MHDEQRLEEQALSKAAEITLSSQLDAAEKIDVDVQTDLLKIIMGHADSVAIAGQGLVMQEDIRVQEMELHIDQISIDPVSAILGQIKLNQPVDATVRIVLTEQDINRALNSKYILSRAQNLELNVDGQLVKLGMQQMELHLPDGDKMVFKGTTVLHEIDKTQQVDFTNTFRPRTTKRPVLLESFQCMDGQSMSLEVAVAFMEKIKELVNLPYFEVEQMTFRIQNMEVKAGSITLQLKVNVRQIPT